MTGRLDDVAAATPRRGLLDGAAAGFAALAILLGGRQLLLGNPASGGLACAAAVALLALWLRRRPRPSLRSVALGLGLAAGVWSALLIALAASRGPDGRLYFSLFDDAFISLRYAWNLAHGQGLVWNPAERVEGFTNLLWTLLLAVPCLALDRSGAALGAQLMGAGTYFAAAFAAGRLAGRLQLAAPALAFVVTLAFYPLAYWSLLGMETGLLSLLLVLAVTAAVTEHPGLDLRLPVLLGLAVATRPDAIVLAVILLAYRAATARPRSAAVEAAVLAAFPLAIAVFRRAYYGSLLPNTYVLKMEGIPLTHRLRVGSASALEALAWLAPLIALALLGMRWRDRRRVLLLGLWLASLLVHVYMGGDAWPRWRFFCPSLPLLGVLAVEGVQELAARLRRAALGPVTLALALALANGAFLREVFLADYPFGVTDVQQQAGVAAELSRICTPDAVVGVFYAGAVPYYTGLRAVDFLGKTDPHVARRPPHLQLGTGHNKTDLAYSIGVLRPDYVEELAWGADSAGRAAADYENIAGLWLRRGSSHVRWELVERHEPRSRPAARARPSR